jgi:CHAT domain-containing protein
MYTVTQAWQRWFWLGWLILLPWYALAQVDDVAAKQQLLAGKTALHAGKFETAIQMLQTSVDQGSLSELSKIEFLIQIAIANQALGKAEEAEKVLKSAIPFAKEYPEQRALIYSSLSDINIALRQYTQARGFIDKSLQELPNNARHQVRATVLNSSGNVFAVEAHYPEAIGNYQEALQLLKQDDGLLQTRVLVNLLQTYAKNSQIVEASRSLSQAYQLLSQLQQSNYSSAFAFISLGELAQRIEQNAEPPLAETDIKSLHSLSYNSLKTALTLAEKLDDYRLISYATGYLGQLYEMEKRYPEALSLTRQAIFAAQSQLAQEVAYRWDWQLGRIFRLQKQIDKAIDSYENAVENLKSAHHELSVGYRNALQSFRDSVGPVYFELADLLLQKANQSNNAEEKQKWLRKARETIELMKKAEIEDYFQGECLGKDDLNKKTELDQLSLVNTAILYPILLPDRIEVLLMLANEIQEFIIPKNENMLKNEVNEFRFELETKDSPDFLPYAQRLYQWLIAPLAATLQQREIDTLIFVPDGVLRTIPLAALHDGQQFLVEKYALAIVPGLELMYSPRAINWNNAKILLSGLSEGVKNFAPLLNVKQEIETIHKLYPDTSTVLLNEEFTLKNFSNALTHNTFSVVHIASHGVFNSDPQKTFLLTYQEQLNMNQLDELIQASRSDRNSIDLLTMSACETAVGDDQAALGLAGIALKAGAKSALATLWVVDDRATMELITEFYRQMQPGILSKAKALQNAQKTLLKQSRYQYPLFWAPFLLVGNWM